MARYRLLQEIGLGIRTLMMHKLRSVLTMLGVVFGVSSVIAMLAVGEGAGQEALDQIRRLGSRNIIVTSIKPKDDEPATLASGGRTSLVSGYGLTYADDIRIRRSIPSVLRTVPAKVVEDNARLGSNRVQLRMVGTTPEWFELVTSPLIAGRVLVEADMRDRKNVCVLTEHGARELLATANSLGESIRIGAHYFDVVGIVRTGIRPKETEKNTNGKTKKRRQKIEITKVGGIITPYTNADVYIPLSVFKEQITDTIIQRIPGAIKGERVELHKIIIEVASMAEVEPTAHAIEAVLKRFHKRKDYRVEVPYTLLRQAEDTQFRSNIVLGSIAGISLLVGGIGIMNIMLASVTERTREIGIRRAIGAQRGQIIRQFLIEATVLSTAGGLIGIAIGVVIPMLIEHFFGMATIIPLYSIVLSLGISMAAGIAFGLYPAIRAANLDPIDALRHE